MATFAHPNNVGNTKKGTDRPQSKLDDHDVRNIRHLYGREIAWSDFDNELDRMLVVDLARRGRWTYKALGWYFGVHYTAIACVIKGRTWGHVD